MTDLDLDGHWQGWRLRGRHLISPDGDRLTPERLKGLCWRDSMELRRAGYESRRRAEAGRRAANSGPKVKVVLVDLCDLRVRNQGAG